MKFNLTLIIMILSTFFLPGKGLSLEFGSAYNQFNGDVKSIYSGSNVSYGIDFSYGVSDRIQLFSHLDFLSVKGKTTYSKEDTTLSITPVEFGGRFVSGDKFKPYFGAGVGSYGYKEANEIGEVSGSGFGFFGEGGFFYYLGKMFFDLKIKYVSLKIDNVNLGAVKVYVGIGIRF